MPEPYAKPHLSYERQVGKLIERGLHVPDVAAAAELLRHIGYYRLTGYLHSFRPIDEAGPDGHDQRLNSYVEGSTFEQVVALWRFDRGLRLLLLDGLEQFEMSLRTSLAYRAGMIDPFIHHRPELLAQAFVDGSPSPYDEWLEKYEKRLRESKNEAFVKWFEHKYESRLPIWTAIEILEVGQAVRLIHGLPTDLRRQIAGDFGLARPRAFESWINSLNGVRNFCAHHARLWNRTLITIASRPREGEIPRLDHLADLDGVARVKVYAPIAFLVWCLDRTPWGADWKRELIRHLRTFPDLPQGSLANAGFPEEWESLELWAQ